MLKLFLTPRLEKIPYVILFRHLGGSVENRLFQNVTISDTASMFSLVSDVSQSDFVAIPYNYFALQKNLAYIQECTNIAEKNGKKLLLFAYGDSDEAIVVPNSVIVRTSQYKYKKADNEIIMPAYVEDLGKNGIEYRQKNKTKPVISFVGWAGFTHFSDRLKYMLRVGFGDLKSVWNRHASIHKPGLYFRRKALHVFSKSSLVQTAFTVRSSYSGHRKTIALSPEEARAEFIDKVSHSDFALAVKGDGNYSLRFFEILSLGRIPVLVDTDCPLPLEDRIRYDDFIVRIDHMKVKNADIILSDMYTQLSAEHFIEMQKKARIAFEQFLSAEVFFRILCSDLEKKSHEK